MYVSEIKREHRMRRKRYASSIENSIGKRVLS